MIAHLLFALTLQTSPASDPARTADRAAMAGTLWTVPGERLSELEDAEIENAAYTALAETALIDSVEICARLDAAASRLQMAEPIIAAWEADSLGGDLAGTETTTIAARSDELAAASSEAQSALSGARIVLCGATRP